MTMLSRALRTAIPIPDGGASLGTAFDYVWNRLDNRLEGLTDDEYFWEPVAGCWSVRRGPDDNWYLDSAGPGEASSQPPPFTTIGWRICHLAISGLGGFTDVLFEGRPPVEDPVAMPSSAAAARAALAHNFRRWRTGLQSESRLDWWRPLGGSFGEFADSTKLDLAIHVFDELVHHGAEMSLLRDLYLRR